MAIETLAHAEWKLEYGTAATQVGSESLAELSFDQSQATLAVINGAAVTKPGNDREPLTTAAGNLLVSSVADGKHASELLKPDQQQRIESWTAPLKPSQGPGQLLVKDSQSGAFMRLNIAQYHANVVLQPPAALVQIDQSFYNPSAMQQEGTFIFNLPRGASVSRFAMYVTPDRLIEGELIGRERAARPAMYFLASLSDAARPEERVPPVGGFHSSRLVQSSDRFVVQPLEFTADRQLGTHRRCGPDATFQDATFQDTATAEQAARVRIMHGASAAHFCVCGPAYLPTRISDRRITPDHLGIRDRAEDPAQLGRLDRLAMCGAHDAKGLPIAVFAFAHGFEYGGIHVVTNKFQRYADRGSLSKMVHDCPAAHGAAVRLPQCREPN